MSFLKRSDKPHEPTFWEYPPLPGLLSLLFFVLLGVYSLSIGILGCL